MPIKTFLDSNILIAAWQGKDDPSSIAFQILYDPNRDFVTTSLGKLETLGHALYGKRVHEEAFYRDFFDAIVTETVEVDEALVAEAIQIAQAIDACGIDALHIAAAVKCGSDELLTSERKDKPMHREQRLKVIHIPRI